MKIDKYNSISHTKYWHYDSEKGAIQLKKYNDDIGMKV